MSRRQTQNLKTINYAHHFSMIYVLWTVFMLSGVILIIRIRSLKGAMNDLKNEFVMRAPIPLPRTVSIPVDLEK